MYDELSQVCADLLRTSYIKQVQGRHAVTFEPGDRVMVLTYFLPKFENSKKIVSVPTRLLKSCSGDFHVLVQLNSRNFILDIKGINYATYLSCLLKYKPFDARER